MTRQSKQAEGKLAEMVIDVVAHTDLTTGEVGVFPFLWSVV